MSIMRSCLQKGALSGEGFRFRTDAFLLVEVPAQESAALPWRVTGSVVTQPNAP
jgi:hypothetical protein